MGNDCTNCTHFRIHYVKHGARMGALSVGHCSKFRQIELLGRKMPFRAEGECEFYEKKIETEPTKEEIEQIVCRIQRQLDDLLFFYGKSR